MAEAYRVQRVSSKWRLELIQGAVIIVVASAPVLFLSPFYVIFFGNVALYGTLALSLYLAWTMAGVLSFGQAVFFGVGAYAAAYGDIRLHGLVAEVGSPI